MSKFFFMIMIFFVWHLEFANIEAAQVRRIKADRENHNLSSSNVKVSTPSQEIMLEKSVQNSGETHVQSEESVLISATSEGMLTSTNKVESGLVLNSWRWVNQTELNRILIEGVVNNNSIISFDQIKIVIVAKDANGKFLGTDWTYLIPSQLYPDGKSTFKIFIDDAICRTNSMDISTQFEFFPINPQSSISTQEKYSLDLQSRLNMMKFLGKEYQPPENIRSSNKIEPVEVELGKSDSIFKAQEVTSVKDSFNLKVTPLIDLSEDYAESVFNDFVSILEKYDVLGEINGKPLMVRHSEWSRVYPLFLYDLLEHFKHHQEWYDKIEDVDELYSTLDMLIETRSNGSPNERKIALDTINELKSSGLWFSLIEYANKMNKWYPDLYPQLSTN